MRFVDCENFEDLSTRASTLVLAELGARPDLLLCAATGRSPTGMYRALADAAGAEPGVYSGLRIVALDEWGGVRGTTPGSTRAYLQTHLIAPLGVSADRVLAFDGAAPDPAAECARVRSELERRGPIDLCVLGLGTNGHVGFNEPGPALVPHCHVARLTDATRQHAMTRAMTAAPEFGLTLGMGEILAARRILLLVTGDGKRDATTRLRSAQVTPALPASFLWLHRNVDCLIDRGVLG